MKLSDKKWTLESLARHLTGMPDNYLTDTKGLVYELISIVPSPSRRESLTELIADIIGRRLKEHVENLARLRLEAYCERHEMLECNSPVLSPTEIDHIEMLLKDEHC